MNYDQHIRIKMIFKYKYFKVPTFVISFYDFRL